jgi:holliday junction DNA helicase RuvB
MFEKYKAILGIKQTEIFDEIEGYEDLKQDIIMPALEAENAANVLFTGPPATAKTMFLDAIRETYKEQALYFSGTAASGKGLIEVLSKKPGVKILCVDEIDKLNRKEQTALYDLLEKGRIVYLTGKLKLNFEIKNLKVFATSNSLDKLNKPLQSRFTVLHLPEYTIEEFERIAVKMLGKKYKLLPEVAIEIAKEVWTKFDSHDVRLLRHIGVLITKKDRPEDIERKILTMKKYKRFEETEFN